MQKETEDLLHLPVYKLYKLFKEQSFVDNMAIISGIYDEGIGLFGTLFCVQICVVQLLYEKGMRLEPYAYIEVMKKVLKEVEDGNKQGS